MPSTRTDVRALPHSDDLHTSATFTRLKTYVMDQLYIILVRCVSDTAVPPLNVIAHSVPAHSQ